MLSILTAIRGRGPGARLVDTIGLAPADVRAAAAAFVSEFSATGSGPMAVFERIDNPRIRTRLRQATATVLFEAFRVLEKAVANETSGYGGAAGAAALMPVLASVEVLLELR